MGTNFTRRFISITCAAFALLTLLSVQPQVHADEGPEESITFVFGKLGIMRDQTLRYTWANLNDSDPSKRDFEPLLIRVRLLAEDGSVIAQKEAAAVGAGQSQSFDFNRNEIRAPGELGTERLQSQLEVTLRVTQTRTGFVSKQSILQKFADTAEVFDNFTGRTRVSVSCGVNRIIVDDTSGTGFFNPKLTQIISAGKDYLFGIAREQTVRLVVARVNGEASKPPPPDVTAGGWILDSSGRVVLQIPEIQIPVNEFRIFDFSASALLITAEGTGRKQVHLVVTANGDPANLMDLFVPWVELVGPLAEQKLG